MKKIAFFASILLLAFSLLVVSCNNNSDKSNSNSTNNQEKPIEYGYLSIENLETSLWYNNAYYITSIYVEPQFVYLGGLYDPNYVTIISSDVKIGPNQQWKEKVKIVKGEYRVGIYVSPIAKHFTTYCTVKKNTTTYLAYDKIGNLYIK